MIVLDGDKENGQSKTAVGKTKKAWQEKKRTARAKSASSPLSVCQKDKG